MEDVQQQADRLRRAADEASRRHAAALAGAAEAATRAGVAMEELSAEFGVSSLEEAAALQQDLRARAQAEAARVESLLQASGEAR